MFVNKEQIILRRSPFFFIKLLVIIEFFFALLPFLFAWFLGVQQSYEAIELSSTLSFSLLLSIVITTLQILIIGFAFVVWYFPAYQIDKREIIYRRANLFEDKKLIDTQSIVKIDLHYGPIGRRLNYGDLILLSSGFDDRSCLKSIPDPPLYAEYIDNLIESISSLPIPTGKFHLSELISGGETQYVEFKASLVWDYHRQMANKELYVPVMKNLVAFLNSSGGKLLIGISDDGDILGLDPDLQTLPRANVDGFENVFNQAFNKMIGVEYRQYLDVSFPEVLGKIICMIVVQQSPKPAYLVHRGNEKFYIRAGNGTQSLAVSKAMGYIQSHFSNLA